MNVIAQFAGLPSFISEASLGLLRQNGSALAASMRRRLHGGMCAIDTQVVIKNRHNFHAGDSSALYHGCYILNEHGYFSLGSHSHLGAFCYVNACYGKVILGDHVAIGPGTKLFSYSNHYRAGCNVTDEKLTANIMIGKNVFIGANSTVLPGTEIGDNVIIGAGSIVKGRLQGDATYVGAPCRLVRSGWYSGSNPMVSTFTPDGIERL